MNTRFQPTVITKLPSLVSAALLLVMVAVFVVQPLQAQEADRTLVQTAARSNTVRRVALVIGNGAYTTAPPLKNPPNDAREMAATLSALGFDVTSGVNLGQREMKRLIREFGQKLKAGGHGLFYYAGHGVQARGRNYIIPVDAEIQNETDVEDLGVDIGLVLGNMDEAQNGLNIVILDACRNNPFARSFRSASDGLAQVDAPTGTLIAYATAPGRVAADGTGENGIYTAELLKAMRLPGLTATEMFMQVRAAVMKQTGNRQVPWEASSLVGAFYFNGAAKTPMMGTQNNVAEPRSNGNGMTITVANSATIELSYWETIKASTDAQDFVSYLEKYPQGQFVDLARRRAGEALISAASKHNNAGVQYLKDNAFVEAAAEFRTAIFFNPTKSQFHRNLARTLEKAGKATEAEAANSEARRLLEVELKDAVKKQPTDESARRALTDYYKEQKRFSEVEAVLREAVALNVNDQWAHKNLAEFYKGQKRFSEAEAEYKEVLRLTNYDWGEVRVLTYLYETLNRDADSEAILREGISRASRPIAHAQLRQYLGEIFERRGDFEAAKAQYREAIKFEPTSEWLYVTKIADALVKQKKIKDADAEWKSFVKRNPADELGHKYFAEYLKAQKRWKEAEVEFRELLRLKPDAVYVDELANTLTAQQRFAEAEAEWREFVKQKPEAAHHARFAKFLHDQKKFAEAETAYRDALRLDPNNSDYAERVISILGEQKRFADVETEWRALLMRKPSAEGHKKFADFLVTQKKFAEAEAQYRDMLRLTADVYNHLAFAQFLRDRKRLSEAETQYREAGRAQPESARAWANAQLGHLLANQKKWKEAEEAFREATRLAPSEVLPVEALANALLAQNKPTEAEAELTALIKRQPGLFSYRALGIFFQRQKRLVEAEAAFRECKRLGSYGPGYLITYLLEQKKFVEAEKEAREEIRSNSSYLMQKYLGDALANQGKLPEAETAYREAARMEPEYGLFYLAEFLRDQQRWAEAETVYKEGFRIRSEKRHSFEQYYNDLAYVLSRLQKQSEAETEYKKAEAYYRKSIETYEYGHHGLGVSLEGQGRLTEAEAAYREAIRISPDHEKYRESLQRVLKAQGKAQ